MSSIPLRCLKSSRPSKISSTTKGRFFGPEVDIGVFTHLPGPENVYFVESPDLFGFGELGKYPVFQGAKTLTLGVIGFYDKSISLWDIPPSLENLTLFVSRPVH